MLSARATRLCWAAGVRRERSNSIAFSGDLSRLAAAAATASLPPFARRSLCARNSHRQELARRQPPTAAARRLNSLLIWTRCTALRCSAHCAIAARAAATQRNVTQPPPAHLFSLSLACSVGGAASSLACRRQTPPPTAATPTDLQELQDTPLRQQRKPLPLASLLNFSAAAASQRQRRLGASTSQASSRERRLPPLPPSRQQLYLACTIAK